MDLTTAPANVAASPALLPAALRLHLISVSRQPGALPLSRSRRMSSHALVSAGARSTRLRETEPGSR